jgi:hypothetical protein
MNKIKVLYDVVKTMKGKEVFKGILKVDGKKGGEKFLGIVNEFEKNQTEGRVKSKLNTEFNYEGKSFKHESNTDFNMEGCGSHEHHGFMKHMHMHMHKHNHDQSEMRFGGPREGLNKIGFALGILNSIKLEEKEDKSAIVKLNLMDLPEEMKELFHEKMKKGRGNENSENHEFHKNFGGENFKGHQDFMKELHGMKNPNVEINVWINGYSEVEKILITATGKVNEESDAKDIDLKAELNLVW